MIHYEPIKVTINALGLIEVIIVVIGRHHDLPDLIVSYRGSVFTSKFWSSLCYFLGIKQRLSTIFHPQIYGQTKRQNGIMVAYFRVFVNNEQNNWARLLLMARFAYNNAKNTSINYIVFELNCGFYPRVFYEEDIDLRFQSKSTDVLATKL